MRRTGRISRLACALALASLLAACGFKPIYAVPDGKTAGASQLVQVTSIAAPDVILPLVTDALNERIVLREGQSPEYDLFVEVRERAERLAVQIDATVTRYNYRLISRYSIIDRNTGKRLNGRAQAVTSYNIVTSQYSTLFAENTAREKAANLLAEEIERDILIRLAEVGADGITNDDEGAIDAIAPGIVREDDLLRDFDDVPDPTPFDYDDDE